VLTAMTIFLIISAKWDHLYQVAANVALDTDPSERPLAVLRLRGDRGATVDYFRADLLPDARAASVRQIVAPLPPPPVPKDIERLEQWVHDDGGRRAFFTKQLGWRPAPQPEWRRMLVAEGHHASTDWQGIRHALVEARNVGIRSKLVYVEADDEAHLDAIIGALDLCRTLSLHPVLRLQ
jgi:hypothetical protein